MINKTHVEGYIYNHTLEIKEAGPNSKNPGTIYITGNLEVATDNAMTNIVTIHFTYTTEKTSKGKPNNTFNVLKDIVEERLYNVMKHGADKASMVSVDTTIGLNEFYSNRNGQEELVSAKRNEGGFVSVVSSLKEDEAARSTFEVDMVITGTRMMEADEEKNLPEKLILKGGIFDFRKALLPVEISVATPISPDGAIPYFEGLGISQSEPVFTKIRGQIVSEVVKRTVTEESAFGAPSVREYSSTRKDWVVTWAASEPYAWDDESTITAAEMKTAMEERATHLATLRARQEEYNASKNQAAAPATTPGAFNF
jgi:DNA-binding transcriptional regulator YhcF (GntR family)